MKDVVFEIEDKFPGAKDIEVNGVKMWPFIRIVFRYLIFDKTFKGNSSNHNTFIQSSTLLGRIKRKLLPNLSKWFKRYDVIIFSNDSEKKMINGKYVDKLSEGIVEYLNPGRTLTINYFSSLDINLRLLKNKNSVDGLLIGRLIRIIKMTTKISINRNDKDLLKAIISFYGLEWGDLEFGIRTLIAQTNVIKLFLVLQRPKYVVTSCYSSFSEIWAAKQKGIKTIELQHGVISPLHPGYESSFFLNKDFTADYLFLFGKNSLKGLDNNIVNKDNAYIVGNYFLECLESLPKNADLLKLIENYSRSVCVPTDFVTERGILEFIIPVARRCTDVIFLVVPRTGISEYGKGLISGVENIKVISQYSFQDVVRHCNFHTATNSTCCLEALSLGIPNILIDLDNEVHKMYRDLVSESFTKFVSSTEEYIEILMSWNWRDPDIIKESNKDNFESNYKLNLSETFKKIGLSSND